MDIFSKELWLTSTCLFTFFIKESIALTLCPNVTWSINATTVAGSPVGIRGSNASYLWYPNDLFVDNNNAIYVLDTGNKRVQRWLPNAISGVTIIQGINGSQLDQFILMADMHVDADGNIYILDMGNVRVTKWTPGATVGSLVAGGNGYGDKPNQLNDPSEMYIGTNTSVIWIADTWNDRIVKWTSLSNNVTVYGRTGGGPGDFMRPNGVFIDESDQNTMYVADTENFRIQRWLAGATRGTTVAGLTGVYGDTPNLLSWPMSILVDKNKIMYILSDNTIIRWKVGMTFGEVISSGSTFEQLPNQYYIPYHIAFDSDSNLFVADSINHRIQKFFAICLNTATSSSTTTTSSSTTTKSSSTMTPNTTSTYISTTSRMSTVQLSTSSAATIRFVDLVAISRIRPS